MDTTKQVYHLTEDALSRLVEQGSHTEAVGAQDKFQKIKADGGTPRCFYSERHGFAVLDADNPSQWERIMSLEASSEPFPI